MSTETHQFQRQKDQAQYHRYVKSRGAIADATDMLDQRIRHLRRMDFIATLHESDIREIIQPKLNSANIVLDDTDPFTDGTSWNDYYRLLGRASFAAELVLASHIFASDDSERRMSLVNGTSGLATNIVDHALQDYYDVRATEKDRRQLRGVVNEYTPLALINYRQDGRSISLPGSLAADTVHKIDSIYYGTNERGKHFKTFVQAKSRYRPKNENLETDKSVAYIYANDYGNSGRQEDGFGMSILLVNDYLGRQLQPADGERILSASSAIENHILQQRNPSNTKYSKY